MCGGCGEVGTKRALTKDLVLDELKNGKTVTQIAEEFKVNKNRVSAHVRRLKAQGLWAEKESTKEIDYDKLLNAWLKRMEKTLDLEKENVELKNKIYRLENQLAAVNNELAIAKEELNGKKESMERVKQIQKRLNAEHLKLSEEASR